MAQGFKTGNEYERAISPKLYAACPKAVLAAIAVCPFFNSETEMPSADALILHEWQMLYNNGIVPQAPPKAVSNG